MKQLLQTIFVSPMILLLCCCSTVLAGDNDDRLPPAEIILDTLTELYEPVVFDHGTHMEMYGCGSCHHHTTGDEPADEWCLRCHAGSQAIEKIACSGCHAGSWTEQRATAPGSAEAGEYHTDILRLKGALHHLCLGCHRSQSGPTGCLECHDYTAAGRRRFAAPD